MTEFILIMSKSKVTGVPEDPSTPVIAVDLENGDTYEFEHATMDAIAELRRMSSPSWNSYSLIIPTPVLSVKLRADYKEDKYSTMLKIKTDFPRLYKDAFPTASPPSVSLEIGSMVRSRCKMSPSLSLFHCTQAHIIHT